MAIVKLRNGLRVLARDYQTMEVVVLYGHGVEGNRLPQLDDGLILNGVMQFIALPFVRHDVVAAGDAHTAVVQADGRLACFGRNRFGQCDAPADLGPVVSVAAGAYHTAAMRADGQLVCFGWNDDGQCDAPADLGPVVSVAAGFHHTAAMRADGQLVCFGRNNEGQCDAPADLGPVVSVTAGLFHTAAVRADGQLVCFGGHDDGQCDAPADLGPVVSVTAGCDHTVAVRADGQLVCFGGNDEGQCDAPADLGPLGSVTVWDARAITRRSGGLNGGSRGSQLAEVQPPVQETVLHEEDAARIAPSEAALIVDHQRASWILHNSAAAMASTASQPLIIELEPVVLLQVSRSTAEFHDALAYGPELETVRAALEQADHRWLLPSGAMIFTDPYHFQPALRAAQGQALQPCHVVVSESLEPFVLEAIRQLPSRQKVRIRRRELVAYAGRPDGDEDDELAVILVRRSFLELSQAQVVSPHTVVQSTTEVNERRATNPRRWRPN